MEVVAKRIAMKDFCEENWLGVKIRVEREVRKEEKEGRSRFIYLRAGAKEGWESTTNWKIARPKQKYDVTPLSHNTSQLDRGTASSKILLALALVLLPRKYHLNSTPKRINMFEP